MNNFKYANLQDLREFLEKLGWIWCDKIKTSTGKKVAEIQDFEYGATLLVYDNLITDEKSLSIYFDDHEFQVYKNTTDKKCDFDDYSIQWQNFLMTRKDKSYSAEVYLKSLTKKKSKETEYNKNISLIRRQIEEMKYKKDLESSKLNTVILNSKKYLSKEEVEDLNKKAEEIVEQ